MKYKISLSDVTEKDENAFITQQNQKYLVIFKFTDMIISNLIHELTQRYRRGIEIFKKLDVVIISISNQLVSGIFKY